MTNRSCLTEVTFRNLGILAGVLWSISSAAFADARLVTLLPRPGVSLNLLVESPTDAKAVLILLEGGPGWVQIEQVGGAAIARRNRGFLAGSWNLFAASGLAVVLMDAPSDQQYGRGLLEGGFRSSSAHRADIGSVVTWARREFLLPVWLAGISIGSRSAAGYAVHGKVSIDGLVLLSSSTNPPGGRLGVQHFGFDRLKVPLLAVAHRGDSCFGTPPVGAGKIVRNAIASRAAKVLFVHGGQETGGHPCRPFTHHTFYGVEQKVVNGVAAFIHQMSGHGR